MFGSGDDEGDGVATPVPLPATAPRADQRFTISGHPGLWRLVTDGLRTGLDVGRPRTTSSVLAGLGERLCEFSLDSEF